jgi:hypothetical protein
MSSVEKRTPAAVLLLAWLAVGVPLAWGVSQTWKNAAKLFPAPQPATATSAPQK